MKWTPEQIVKVRNISEEMAEAILGYGSAVTEEDEYDAKMKLIIMARRLRQIQEMQE